MPKSNLLSLGLRRDGGLCASLLMGKMERPDCLAARDGIWGNTEKVGDVFRGGSTAVRGGAGTETSLLIIDACSDLGPLIDPEGVGTRSAFLTTSSGKASLGKYDVGPDDDVGVDGLVKWTSSGLIHPSGFCESAQGVTLLLERGEGRGGMYMPPIPPTLAGSWFFLLLSSASEGCNRSGDGFRLAWLRFTGSEEVLPFRLEGKSTKLLDDDPGFGALLQSTNVAFGAKMYEGVGELGLDWATPPVYPCSRALTPNKSPSPGFFLRFTNFSRSVDFVAASISAIFVFFFSLESVQQKPMCDFESLTVVYSYITWCRQL
jgi:hypothetical protein